MTRFADDLKWLWLFFVFAVSLCCVGSDVALGQTDVKGAVESPALEKESATSVDNNRASATNPGNTEEPAASAIPETETRPPGVADHIDDAVGVFNGWVASVLFFDIPLWIDSRHVQWSDPSGTAYEGEMSDDGRVIDLAGLDLRLERETPVSDNPLDPVGAWRDAGGTAYVVEKKDDEYHVRSASMPADEAVPTLSVGATQSIPFAVLWLVIGATFFTLRMGFISIRGFKHAILVTMGKYDDPEDVGEVSHFQALSAALSATVGLGNIAGVAIAVILGGPGATFWLIVAGFLGMTSKMVECTLGQMYREVRPDGRIMGGAMFYLSKGLQEIGFARLGKFLAITFALLCVGASFGGGNAFQVNQSLNAVAETIPALQDLPNGDPSPHRWIYGAVMTAMGAVVILGGIRRIAKAAEMIVPAMCGIYVLAGLAIIGMNIDHVPGAMREILDGAFRPEGMYGGLIGVLVTGFKRAAFSNEAGVGSAAIAHSAAKTDYPVREGLVALLEPFIDTIVVCSMSALVIVITGAYNNPAFQDAIDAQRGAALMSRAMDSQIPGFRWILSLSVFLFAYSTMISWSYYGERCCAYLFGDRSSLTYRLIFLVFTFLGSITTAQNVLDLSDLMILGMAVPNILGLFLLSGVVKKALDEYWGKYKSGEFKMTK